MGIKDKLKEEYGSVEAYLDSLEDIAVVMGYCTNENCSYQTNVEPDLDVRHKAKCPKCTTGLVVSPLAWLGYI